MAIKIQHFEINDNINILGHVFAGLEDIDKAVEVATRISNSIGSRYIRRIKPEKPVEGIHVLRLYEPYPCFDASDFMYENRQYCNYFFSTKPFNDKEIEQLAKMPVELNYCMVFEGMNQEVLPALYFGGYSYDKPKLATLD